VAFAVAVVMFALAVGIYLGLTNIVISENEPAVKWLPSTAKDVSYYRSYDYTAFEFTIPEADFLAWVKSNQWDKETKPIEAPFKIGRYTAGPTFQRKPDDPLDHTAAKGYFMARFFKGREGNDEGMRAAYDAENGRAYYTWKPSQGK